MKLTKKDDPFIMTVDPKSSIGKKLKYLKNLNYSNVHSPNALDEIKNLLPEAFSVADERNRFIHDNWIFSSEDLANGGLRRISINSMIDGKFDINASNLYTEELLLALSSRIGALQTAFGKLYESLEHEIQE